MLTKDNSIILAQDFVKEVLRTGLILKKVILFGSFAKNNPHEFSDIDLAMVADEFTGFGFEDIRLFAKVHIKKNYYLIQPVTFPTEYFEKGDPFIEEIKKTGIEIKIRNINQ